MLKQIFIPTEQNHFVDVPQQWYGNEIEVIMFPVNKRKPRSAWAEAARNMHIAGDDKLLIPDTLNNKNTDWWQWE